MAYEDYTHTTLSRNEQEPLLGSINYLTSLVLRAVNYRKQLDAVATDSLASRPGLLVKGVHEGADFTFELGNLQKRFPDIAYWTEQWTPYSWEGNVVRHYRYYEFAAGRRRLARTHFKPPYALAAMMERYQTTDDDGEEEAVPIAYPDSEFDGAHFFTSEDHNLELSTAPKFGIFDASVIDELTRMARNLGLHAVGPVELTMKSAG